MKKTILMGLIVAAIGTAMIASIGTSNLAIASDETWGEVTSGAAQEDGQTNLGEHSSSFAGERRAGLGNILDDGKPNNTPDDVGKDSDKHPDKVAQFVCTEDPNAAGC